MTPEALAAEVMRRAVAQGVSLSGLVVEERAGAAYLRARYDRDVVPGADGMPEGFPGWAQGRQAEFAAGRVLAGSTLISLGFPPELARGADRAPVWPEGARGAITHTRDEVAVLVAAGARRIGLDRQPVAAGRSLDALRAEVLSAGDRSALEAVPGGEGVAETAGFSAKETLFKALYPEVGRMFGFAAARVVSAGPDRVTLVLTESLADGLAEGAAFDVSLSVEAGVVETWMVAEAV
ncbi:4'-phosphopantetheinyl transferase family protein [Pseudaestuariivita atlantica]|uniref:4'-phosphopantetheinyl transferase family protein n=1 Tax=Pseudaestuariivita atlantica TaxID=1317121 RepID=UPI00106D069A|nr:4'-phosphopantetheinyl transferase superfamily protein [Pseudaestuariivita atlantica]